MTMIPTQLETMTAEESLGSAADLIYTRLDLPQPPDIDLDALLQWASEPNRQRIDQQGLYEKNKANSEYPWVAVYACYQNRWDADLRERFPEIFDYTKNLPATRWRSVVVLCQRPDRDVFLHTDQDWGIGYRMYLNHGGPRTYVQKFKERHANRPGTWASGGPEGIVAMCEPERHYINDSGRYPWAITAIRAAHGVEKNAAALGSRITVVMVPDPTSIDYSAHQALLLRSADKFRDSAIWY